MKEVIAALSNLFTVLKDIPPYVYCLWFSGLLLLDGTGIEVPFTGLDNDVSPISIILGIALLILGIILAWIRNSRMNK